MGVSQEAGGEGEGLVGLGHWLRVAGQRVAVDSVKGVEFFDELLHGLAEWGVDGLACGGADDAVLGVDEDEGGPVADAVAAVHDPVAVVEDGIVDVVAEEGAVQVGVVALGGVFRGVDADEEEFGGEVGLEAFELGQDVEAVDGAGGPEVE